MTKEQKTRKHKVFTPFNAVPDGGKTFTQLSQTIPDQSLPLAVILERHTRGLPMDVAMATPLYEDEEARYNGINPATLDLADFEQLKLENQAEIMELKNQLEYEKSEELRKQREKDIEKFENDQSRKQRLEKRNTTSQVENEAVTNKLPDNSNERKGND